MQNKNNLQDKFKDFGAQPTDALWDSIASNLDNKKKRKAIWFWWIGSGFAAILALGFSLTHQFNTKLIPQHSTTINPKLKETNANTLKEGNKKTEDPTNTTIKVNTANKDILKSNSKQKVQHPSPITPIKTIIEQKNDTKQNLKRPTPSITGIGKQKTEHKNTYSTPLNLVHTTLIDVFNCADCDLKLIPIETRLIPQNISHNLELTPLKTSKKSRKLEYNIHALIFTQLIKESAPTNTLDSQGSTSGITYSGSNESALLPPNNPVLYKTTLPLVLRFGISTKLFKRFKIQSGLDFGWIYTRPVDLSIPINSSNFTVGIPLFLDYTILNKKHFDLSTKLGVINDFSVMDYNKTLQTSTVIFTADYLGGVETNLSINYKINEKLKLGIGTGLKWYYYKSYPLFKPNQTDLSYNLNIGFTWNY